MDQYFESRTSIVHGLGLFSKDSIVKDKLFRMKTSCHALRARCKNTYSLDYYVPPDTCPDAECVLDGHITQLALLIPCLDKHVFVESCVETNDIGMFANDLAWPSQTISEYDLKCAQKNKLELLLVFETNKKQIQLYGVCIRTLTAIAKNEECGITYGFGFWKD